MTDLGSLLNPEQLEAATAPDGPLLILAAAGTGKTRTLVYRVVHLVERGVPAHRILLLTFTNRAAREMLSRADEATRGLATGLWGGTFHHVANRMLRRYAGLLGFPRDFAILDADDQRTLMGRVIKDLGHRPKDFPKRELVLSLLSGAVNRNLDPAEYLESRAGDFAAAPEELLACMREYVKRKRELHAMDFDDLLVNGLRVLSESAEARELYQERFLHVLVDEYQDTNALQSAFVDLLAARHRNLSVVGDDFQCIYSWRGSDYRNIMDFPRRYPDARIVKLERNYRSRKPILDLANASILHNPDQFPKVLRPTREAPGLPPRLLEVADGRAQAGELLSIVEDARRAGYRYGEIAVLYRSHFNAVDAQLALTRAGVPYSITSGTSFYEQAHVKDVVALLRMAETTDDGLAFARVLQLLPAVGETTVDRLWRRLGGRFDAADPAARAALLEALPSRARGPWEPVSDALGAYSRTAFPHNVKALVEAFLDALYRERLRKDFENADEREDELRELLSDIAGHTSVRDFLEDVALLTNLDREGGAADADGEGKVLLSTVHQAKGLEWPVVILLWCVEGIFPSSRALEDQGGDDEERRLFYVAVTRARDRLHILQPHVRTTPDGGAFRCERSRFLREVPPALFQSENRDDRPSLGYGGWGGGWGGGRASAYRGGGGFGGWAPSARGGGYRLRGALEGLPDAGGLYGLPDADADGSSAAPPPAAPAGPDGEPTFGPGGVPSAPGSAPPPAPDPYWGF